jgi:hypothetical protein
MSQAHHDKERTEFARAVEAQLCAFNTAFSELGLRFRWDAQMLTSLAAIDGERQRVTAYIERHQRHLLSAYSAVFLADAILEIKRARMSEVLELPARSEVSTIAQRAQPAVAARSIASFFADDSGVPALVGV